MNIYLVSGRRPTKNQKKQLDELGDFVIVNLHNLTPSEVIEKLLDVEILITDTIGIIEISSDFLSNFKKLKFIALLTIGTEWVDLAAARERGISVSTIKGASSESVAEHIWGMILALAKKISDFDRDIRLKGAFNFKFYQGKEVYGKTIGIIGLGDVGKKVARIAKSFSTKILGINRSGNLVEGVKLTDLNTLLQESDIVAVCVPLTQETENMIGEREISLMKQGAILVNCAREKIVNKEAVIHGIRSRKLFGYGVEANIMEHIAPDDLYLKYPGILVTTHNAFYTQEAEIRSFDTAIENIRIFLKGNINNK